MKSLPSNDIFANNIKVHELSTYKVEPFYSYIKKNVTVLIAMTVFNPILDALSYRLAFSFVSSDKLLKTKFGLINCFPFPLTKQL